MLAFIIKSSHWARTHKDCKVLYILLSQKQLARCDSLGKFLCSGNKWGAPLLWPPHQCQQKGIRVLELSLHLVRSLLPSPWSPPLTALSSLFALRSFGLTTLYHLSQCMSVTSRILCYPSFPRLTPYGSVIHFLFFSFKFYWSIVDLQCCVNFCCTAKWFSYTSIYSFPLWFITGYWI